MTGKQQSIQTVAKITFEIIVLPITGIIVKHLKQYETEQ